MTRIRVCTILARLVRSAGAGALATIADLAALTFLVSLVGLSPHIANVPSLLVGNVVMFFAQKDIAFRARGGNVRREMLLFALVQAGGFTLNVSLYDIALRTCPLARTYYLPARLVTTNLVWLSYSFPVWHLVFRRRARSRSSTTSTAESGCGAAFHQATSSARAVSIARATS